VYATHFEVKGHEFGFGNVLQDWQQLLSDFESANILEEFGQGQCFNNRETMV
jgi:hypothetical protein